MHRRILSLSCVVLTAGLAVAQATEVARASFGVTDFGGAIRAGGAGYSATFDAGGIECRAVGSAARLRFTFASLRRGAVAAGTPDRAVAPIVVGNAVYYRHPAVTEVYEARADGVEQSFVFAERPRGTGDLVVGGRITTDLELVASTADGLRFERDGAGFVFGAVTGVDANGATVRGAIRVQGDRVEWVLPAAFVDGAAYPLVLDPLIGLAFAVGSAPAGSNLLPRVAYDAGTGHYLVVWAVEFASGLGEIRGQLVDSSGALVGSQRLLVDNLVPGQRPALVGVAATGRFLLGWIGEYDNGPFQWPSFTVRSLAASDASGSGLVLLETQPLLAPEQLSCDLGGDRRPAAGGGGAALGVCHTRSGSTSTIYQVRFAVPAVGNPVVIGSRQTLATSTFVVADPVVSPHAGTNGRWLCVFRQGVTGPTASPTRLVGRLVDMAGSFCGPVFIAHDGSAQLRWPAVATVDGVQFAVAWHDTSVDRVRVKPLTWSGICGSGSVTAGVAIDPMSTIGIDEAPALVWAGQAWLVAFRHRTTLAATPRVYVKSLDPATCAVCGDAWLTENTVFAQQEPALASRWDGGDAASDAALVVWSNGSIRARRAEAHGSGAVVSVGGACGAAGGNVPGQTGDPVLGNPTFALTLSAPTAPVLAAIVGLSQAALPCGPCVLVPNLDIVMGGAGPHAIPLPCDLSYLGVSFWVQWLLFAPGGCPILADFGLSDAQQFTIGE